MSFCPNCEDEMLRPARSSQNKTKKVLKCMRCGYEEDAQPQASSGFNADKIRKAQAVIDDGESNGNPNLVIAAICPRCQNDQAATWQVQTRGADEPTTHFYRCTKCSYTWREY
jgi:DNA-directed RNA polymerase subunit M